MQPFLTAFTNYLGQLRCYCQNNSEIILYFARFALSLQQESTKLKGGTRHTYLSKALRES